MVNKYYQKHKEKPRKEASGSIKIFLKKKKKKCEKKGWRQISKSF